MKKIVLIGGGLHSVSCIDVLLTRNIFKISNIVDKRVFKFENYKIISEKDFRKKKIKGKNLHISIGQLKLGNLRGNLFKYYKSKGCKFPKIIASTSYVSKQSFIDEGTILFHRTVINKNATIRKNCIINTGAIIEHDVTIEDNVHIAPGAIILGNVKIGKNSFIGSGSIIKQNKIIKKNTIIPALKYIN